MPFDQPIPHPFTAGAVRIYAPAASGIYGISNAREWIYIAETNNIQGALLDHLQEGVDASLLKRQPTGFVFEVCDGVRRSTRQNCLALEYTPSWNGTSLQSPRTKRSR